MCDSNAPVAPMFKYIGQQGPDPTGKICQYDQLTLLKTAGELTERT